MARIVVLGGTGFIGRHTLAAAVAAGQSFLAVPPTPVTSGSSSTPLPTPSASPDPARCPS